MEISRCVLASLSACVPEDDEVDFELRVADFDFEILFTFGLVRDFLDFRLDLTGEREIALVLVRLARLVFFFLAVLPLAFGEVENLKAICLAVERDFFAILPS